MIETVVRQKIDAEDETTAKLPVLLPSTILKYLIEIGVQMPPQKVAEYWAHHRNKGVPWALAHQSDGSHIPIGIYGDAAKFGDTNDKKVWGIWMNLPLFRPASARMSRYLLFAVEHEMSFGMKTIFPLLQAVVDNLNSFYGSGILGHKFATTEVRGDWEFHYLVFRMKKFWKSSSICWRCLATQGLRDPPATCYLDFSDNPGWKATHHRTHQDFITSVIPSSGLRSLSACYGICCSFVWVFHYIYIRTYLRYDITEVFWAT